MKSLLYLFKIQHWPTEIILKFTWYFYLKYSHSFSRVNGPLTSILSQFVNLGGMALIGPSITSSYYLSSWTIGGKGSEKTQSGRARFMNEFLYNYGLWLRIFLMISIPTAPTIIAVVVAIAGIILPAINLTLKLSTYSIL